MTIIPEHTGNIYTSCEKCRKRIYTELFREMERNKKDLREQNRRTFLKWDLAAVREFTLCVICSANKTGPAVAAGPVEMK